MRYVYVVESHVNFEGATVQGVYDDLDEARRNVASRGDWETITRWDLRNQHSKPMPLAPGGKVQP